MKHTFKIFHYLSYFQYPCLVAAIYYCYKPLFAGMDTFIEDVNLGLLFLGIALSFTSLTDIRKRTKLSDRVFGNPKVAKRWVIYICILLLVIFGMGIFTHFSQKQTLNELSIGIFVLGIGVIGLLRMNLELIKLYQVDWNKNR